jgi:hypothetical protein
VKHVTHAFVLSPAAAAAAAGLPAVMSLSGAGHFDAAGYLLQHVDVKAAGMDGWSHFMNHGHGENRVIVLDNGLRGTFDAGQQQHDTRT